MLYSKHKTSNQCWFNVRPALETMDQHYNNIGIVLEFSEWSAKQPKESRGDCWPRALKSQKAVTAYS